MKFLKRCKNEVLALVTDCKMDLIINQNKHRNCLSASMFGATLVNMAVCALADDDIAGFGAELTSVISEIYSAAFGVVTALAAVCLVIAFVVRMTANQQKAAQATSWIIRILICYVGINVIGLVFKVIDHTTSKHRFDEVYDIGGLGVPASPETTT